jgi:hypothetical protein
MDALPFSQLLQEGLAAVIEAYRVAIGVHFRRGLDKQHFLCFSDAQFALQILGNIPENQTRAGRNADCRDAFLRFPSGASPQEPSLGLRPKIATNRLARRNYRG